VVLPENQSAQAENKSIEEEVTANEKGIGNDGIDNCVGYFNRNFYYGEVFHSRGDWKGRSFHRLWQRNGFGHEDEPDVGS